MKEITERFGKLIDLHSILHGQKQSKFSYVKSFLILHLVLTYVDTNSAQSIHPGSQYMYIKIRTNTALLTERDTNNSVMFFPEKENLSFIRSPLTRGYSILTEYPVLPKQWLVIKPSAYNGLIFHAAHGVCFLLHAVLRGKGKIIKRFLNRTNFPINFHFQGCCPVEQEN